MNKEIVKIAADAIRMSVEEALDNNKAVPEIEGWYFWNPVRGGLSVLINTSGEKLVASSSVSFDKHLKAYKDGKRN